MSRRAKRAVEVLGIALAAASLLACRQIIGIDVQVNPGAEASSEDAATSADAGSDGSPSACGLPYGTTTCASCVQASCCSESSACAGDPSCAGYYECLSACAPGDWACRSQCWIDSSPGTSSQYPPLAVCTVGKCENDCGLTCGALGAAAAAPSAAAACQTCLAMTDCADTRACATSVDCNTWATCSLASPIGTLCAAYADGGVYYDGGTLFTKVQQGLQSCATRCERGSNWSCVGHVDWPPVTSGPCTLVVGTVPDYVTSKPLEGIAVSVCRYQDLNCSSPLAQALTDANGVTLQVPAQNVGTSLDANSYLEATLAGYATNIYFWGFPVVRPGAFMGFALLTTTEAQQALAPHGITWDTTRGLVGGFVFDCSRPWAPASGVRVALDVGDPSIRPFYGLNFDFNATETDGSGFAGFVNVPPGTVTLTATPRAISKPSSRLSVLIRPGTLTQFQLVPTP